MVRNNIIFEDAERNIFSRNFAGKEGKFNPAGRRNFCVSLDYDKGKELEAAGWNIKWLEPKNGEEEKRPFLQVAVSFDNIPPKILLISSRGKTLLDKDSVDILDFAEIQKLDFVVRPYNWAFNGNSGVKAYLKSLYLTIVEDELDRKYFDVPESAADAIGGCGRCETCDGSCDCEHD